MNRLFRHRRGHKDVQFYKLYVDIFTKGPKTKKCVTIYVNSKKGWIKYGLNIQLGTITFHNLFSGIDPFIVK